MAQVVNYDRPKASIVNDTAISISVEGAEVGGVEAALAAGNAPGLQATLLVDADESVGADIQDLARVTVVPEIDQETGEITFVVTLTPVNGDGSDGTARTATWAHPQTMDAWQTAAGRARQA